MSEIINALRRALGVPEPPTPPPPTVTHRTKEATTTNYPCGELSRHGPLPDELKATAAPEAPEPPPRPFEDDTHIEASGAMIRTLPDWKLTDEEQKIIRTAYEGFHRAACIIERHTDRAVRDTIKARRMETARKVASGEVESLFDLPGNQARDKKIDGSTRYDRGRRFQGLAPKDCPAD
jgi:hypothetical protein